MTDDRAIRTERLAYSPDEAATAAGVGRNMIFDEIRNQRLEARKAGRRTVITADALAAWLNSLPKIGQQQVA